MGGTRRATQAAGVDTGKELVVGGGRAGPVRVWDPDTEAWYDLAGMPRHPEGKVVTLNTDPDARPDVVGDINRAPFRDGAFAQVYFEHVEWTSFTGSKLTALDESARMLQSSGQLVIETGSGVRPHLRAVRGRMRELGFKYLRITEQKGGRIRI
jgi:hypothetical protein